MSPPVNVFRKIKFDHKPCLIVVLISLIVVLNPYSYYLTGYQKPSKNKKASHVSKVLQNMKVIKYLILTPSRKSGEKRKIKMLLLIIKIQLMRISVEPKWKKRKKKDEELKSEKKDYDSDM